MRTNLVGTDRGTKLICEVVDAVPQLKRGQVWCYECGRTQDIDAATCMADGWPKCCGYTMSIDSPEERQRLRK